ncbi:MAG: hypothetical protein CNLJKLNK_00490 [Holosporales bacterium]
MCIRLIISFLTSVNFIYASESQSQELFRSILENRKQLEYFQNEMKGIPKNINEITDAERRAVMDNAFKEYLRNFRQFISGDSTLTVLDFRYFDFSKDEWLVKKIFTHDLTKVCEIKLQNSKNVEKFFEKAIECTTFYSLKTIHCEDSRLVLEFLKKLKISQCIRDVYQEHPQTGKPVATVSVYTDKNFDSEDITENIKMIYKSTNKSYTGVLRAVCCH